MVGTTVQTMQKVGWLGVTPIEGLELPYWAGLWLGLFPTWQGVLAQAAAAVFVVGSYVAAEGLRKRRRERRSRLRWARRTTRRASDAGTGAGEHARADSGARRLREAAKRRGVPNERDGEAPRRRRLLGSRRGWQRGQYQVPRPPTRVFAIGARQRGHGSPSRP